MKTLTLATALTAALCGQAWAKIGLAARFGDVILERVTPGRTYSLRDAAKVPLGLENRGDAETEVVIEFEPPMKVELVKGYEPVPDLSWFKAIPNSMRIPAHGLGFFDILMTIPDDPKLVGRHFQLNVKATTRAGTFGVMVQNRIRLSIGGPGPESLEEEKKKHAMQQLDFDISPQQLYLTAVPVGRKWDARKESKKSIRIANFAPDPLAMTLVVEKWDTRFVMPPGYETIPDPSWIKLKSSTVTVESEGIGQANLVVEVPDKPENRGKKWAATIRTGLLTGYWLDSPVKVMLETAP